MALEATHRRFALDLKDKYQVKDLNKYIAGSIYPDSRYITKIDRKLTHPDDFMEWDILSLNDFKKGWHTHLVCDYVQWLVTKEKRPEIFEGEVKPFGQIWIHRTALKVLQDNNDLHHFDILSCLPYLEYIENPNGEDSVTLEKYNQIFIREYSDPETFSLDNSDRIGLALGIGNDHIQEIRLQGEVYLKDPSMLDFLVNVYDEMLNRATSI
ncbi:MAG: hypothetical protein ACYC44_04935 [Patescibacteria group bacterium]